MSTKWTESSIQSLKAQEAKDLAVQFLQQIEAKDRAPITAGQVQLKELQFGLKIKEAEAEDNRRREEHEARIKELELQIEQEKSKQVEAIENADRVRQQHAQLVEQVQAAQESLSIQLERATRECNVKCESLEADYAARKSALQDEQERLEQQNASLVQTIQELTDVQELANDVSQLREQIESQKAEHQRELQRLEEEMEAAGFEKSKAINQIKRDQEVELAELETQHRKQVMQQNMEAATKTLAEAGMTAVSQSEWDSLQRQLQQGQEQEQANVADLRKAAEQELRRAYNITTTDVFDVTELHYREKALAQEAASFREQIGKLETEVARMRQHIEREPDRIAKAVEAAKVQVHNSIEQATRGR